MPVASLPGAGPIGNIGADARRFVDQLARHRLSVWQILPMHPVHEQFAFSPYSSQSLFAADEMYIDTQALGKLSYKAMASAELKSEKGIVDYAFAKTTVRKALDEAFEALMENDKQQLNIWRSAHPRVEGYARWQYLAQHNDNIHWPKWAEGRSSDSWQSRPTPSAAEQWAIDRIVFGQMIWHQQWQELRSYARARGIRILGDLPIYPHLDSADVWQYPKLFKLDARQMPAKVAGVPPDYFSEDGQRWGNPVYDWDRMAAEGFAWWLERLRVGFGCYDFLRIDHFIGLVRAYEIDAKAPDARDGTYVEVPTHDLLAAIERQGMLEGVIAEDLGAEHPRVELTLLKWQIPGMRVMPFGFSMPEQLHPAALWTGDARQPHLPHQYPQHCIAYSGTHDNNTLMGWYQNDLDDATRQQVATYLGEDVADIKAIHRRMLHTLMCSAAQMVILPVQDLLGLGAEARINTPGTTEGNWRWRAAEQQIYEPEMWLKCQLIAELSGRSHHFSSNALSGFRKEVE